MVSATKAIKRALIRIFDLREEEFAKTLRLQLIIFILLTVLLIVKPTVNSLFLKELSSDALPLAYVLTAIFAVLGSVLYNRSLEKYDLQGVIEKTILISVVFLILFGALMKIQTSLGLFYYVMYIGVAIFGLLTASQFWILANLAYNVREAKRVFGFIGAGAIAGAIFGGYLTSLLANYIDTENFLFIAATVLMGSIPLIRITWNEEIRPLSTYQRSSRKRQLPETSLQLIRKSPLLTQISIVVGIGVIVAKLVDYQYSDYASRLIADQDELTSFFGFWLSSLSMVSLFIQLFLTKRIVGTFGVGSSLLWLPAGILVGSLLLIIIPELWVVVFIKIVDGSLKQSVNKSATELLSFPVPLEVKKKTKTFIDVVVDSIATGIAGLLLILFVNGFDLPAQAVSFIIIVLIASWLFFIYQVRKKYIQSFKMVIENHEQQKRPKKERKEIPLASIVDSINNVFSEGSESQILYMLKRTLESPDERFFYQLKNLLSHQQPMVRHLALENLYYLNTEVITNDVEKLLHDQDQEVTTSAFKYLIKHKTASTVESIDFYLNHPKASIQNAALIGLAQELRNQPGLKKTFQLTQKIGSIREELKHKSGVVETTDKTTAILLAIGYGKVSEHYDFLMDQIHSPEPEIAKVALYSSSKTLDQAFVRPITRSFPVKELREAAYEALYRFGEPVIPVLVDFIKNGKISPDVGRFVPSFLQGFGSVAAVQGLLALTSGTEHAIKMESITSLKDLRQQNPELTFNESALVHGILDECTMYEHTLAALHSQILAQYMTKANQHHSEKEARNTLINLLESRLDRQLERIFNFLGLKYPPEDMGSVYDSIVRGKKEERLHAIEFLDNLLDLQLKRELLPLIESATLDTSSESRIKQLGISSFSDIQCFSLLLQRPDVKLKLAVLYLMGQTQDKKYLPILSNFLHDHNRKIRYMTQEAINNIKESTTFS